MSKNTYKRIERIEKEDSLDLETIRQLHNATLSLLVNKVLKSKSYV